MEAIYVGCVKKVSFWLYFESRATEIYHSIGFEIKRKKNQNGAMIFSQNTGRMRELLSEFFHCGKGNIIWAL